METVKLLNAVEAGKFTRFTADVEVGSNGENAKTVPVKILARTSDPVQILTVDDYGEIAKAWMVHDLSTVTMKRKIVLDYNHQPDGEIGYCLPVVQNNSIVATGCIEPYSADPLDKGAMVAAKMKAGIPYEASIETNYGDISPGLDGALVTLNGRNYAGFAPLHVMTNWNLLAIAICKLGRDGATSAELMSRGDSMKPVEVKITKRETTMSTEDKPAVETVENPVTPVVEVSEPVEAPQVETPAVEKAEVVETAPETEKPVEGNPAVPMVDVPATLSVPAADPASVAKQYLTLFGASEGMAYLAAGLSVEDAKTKHMTALSAQVADLTKRLNSVSRGSPTPVQFTPAPRDDVPAPKTGYAGLVNLGKPKK